MLINCCGHLQLCIIGSNIVDFYFQFELLVDKFVKK